MDRNEEGQSIAANLPELVLRLIFSFLSIEDLPRVQKVCTTWEYVTKNVLVWKNAPLRLAYRAINYRYRYPVEYVARVSYLHTIIGNCFNADELFETLVENVIDLRKAKIFIEDYNSLSTVNFHKFIKKFKNLEYIFIDNNIPVVVESLHMLSSCPNLRSVYLRCTGNLDNVEHVCNVIGDGFLALRKLKILLARSTITKDSANAISGLLNKKLNQLTQLNLNDDFRPYLQLISKSTKLEKLKINYFNRGRQTCLETPFNLAGMSGLKSLVLATSHYTSHSHSPGCIPDAYRNIVFPQNLEKLFINLHTDQPTGLIRNIIHSLPNLRYLDIYDVKDADFDEQLEGINNLPNLHTVLFTCCRSLSVSGVEYIMNNCKGLRKLRIPGKSFTDSTFESLKNCVYLQELLIDSCKVNVDKLLLATMPLKYLTNVNGEGYCGIDKYGRRLCGYEVNSYIKQGRKKHYEKTANI